ncbi:MAG: hypothetical protein NTW74_15040 [Acidobacteria bacterium]|nr:hypothetical protein [Acidobacteriota bacterium]
MRSLFDHGTSAPLIPFLARHIVTQARDAGWDRLTNGDLLNAAESAGFQVLVTTDKNMRYQQNLSGRVISIVVLGNSQWRVAVNYVEVITAAVDDAKPGSYVEIDIPLPPKKPFSRS